MEHGSDDREHYSKPGFYYNLLRYRNKLKWLFRNCDGNCFCQFLTECDRDSITDINLCRRFINANCQWCFILSLEYRRNDNKYHCQSRRYHHLRRHWN